MPSFRSPKSQAQFAARSLRLKSQGTERDYQSVFQGAAAFLREQQKGSLRDLDQQKAIEYLEHRAAVVAQKTLDMDRQALQALLKNRLPVIKSQVQTQLSSRAYSSSQVEQIAKAQRPGHALATRIAYGAGLRAHELLSIRPAAEQSKSDRRGWSDDRFSGRSGERYTVHGKGGLVREVLIPKDLAKELEARRLSAPATVYDRGIGYRSLYDIGGGHAWSDSFSKASQRALGFTHGAHGLRHSYAQERMQELKVQGLGEQQGLSLVSQELGHFRSSITLVYLR